MSRVHLAGGRARSHRTHRGFAAAAVPVRPIRRQTPRGLVRISIRLHHAPAPGGRSDPRVARVDHRAGRSFRRPGNQIAQVLCTEYDVGVGIGWHRDKPHFDRVFGLSLGSACKFRFRQAGRHQVGAFHARGRPRSIYMMSGAVAGGLGTQHPCRRGAALLDHLPDDGREILSARPNLCYLRA